MSLNNLLPEIRALPGGAGVTLVGFCKEVAPTAKVETDEKLGVSEFQAKYFPDGLLYLDA